MGGGEKMPEIEKKRAHTGGCDTKFNGQTWKGIEKFFAEKEVLHGCTYLGGGGSGSSGEGCCCGCSPSD